MSESPILITYRIHPETEKNLPPGVVYAPGIGYVFSENNDSGSAAPTAEEIAKQQLSLAAELAKLKPVVLIVGSDPVQAPAMETWRRAVGPAPLAIIRRGVEVGGIDAAAAAKFGVSIQNTPGINSRPVARHLLGYLRLEETGGDRFIAIVGVGAIGGFIAMAALKKGFKLKLYSPSLADTKTRPVALKKAGLKPSKAISFAPSVSEAVKGASKLVVAVPWRSGERFNRDLIEASDVAALRRPAVIVSAANPGVFSDEALAIMQDRVRAGDLRAHIDTGAIYAKTCRQRFPAIEIEHDVAFSDPKCQMELDKASLAKAYAFVDKISTTP